MSGNMEPLTCSWERSDGGITPNLSLDLFKPPPPNAATTRLTARSIDSQSMASSRTNKSSAGPSLSTSRGKKPGWNVNKTSGSSKVEGKATKTGTTEVTLRDLGPEDRARLAALVQELASLGEEKEALVETLSLERTDRDNQVALLLREKERLEKEKSTVESQLTQSQVLLSTLQSQLTLIHQQPASIHMSSSERYIMPASTSDTSTPQRNSGFGMQHSDPALLSLSHLHPVLPPLTSTAAKPYWPQVISGARAVPTADNCSISREDMLLKENELLAKERECLRLMLAQKADLTRVTQRLDNVSRASSRLDVGPANGDEVCQPTAKVSLEVTHSTGKPLSKTSSRSLVTKASSVAKESHDSLPPIGSSQPPLFSNCDEQSSVCISPRTLNGVGPSCTPHQHPNHREEEKEIDQLSDLTSSSLRRSATIPLVSSCSSDDEISLKHTQQEKSHYSQRHHQNRSSKLETVRDISSNNSCSSYLRHLQTWRTSASPVSSILDLVESMECSPSRSCLDDVIPSGRACSDVSSGEDERAESQIIEELFFVKK